MWLLIISHPSVKFDNHRSCKKEFIAFLICDMTLRNHVINRLYDFVDNRPALEPTALKFGSHRSRGSWNMTFFISHAITWPRAQSVKRLDGWWPFTINLYLAKFGSHRPWGSGDISFFICDVTSCGHVSSGSVTLLVAVPQLNSSVYQVWWP